MARLEERGNFSRYDSMRRIHSIGRDVGHLVDELPGVIFETNSTAVEDLAEAVSLEGRAPGEESFCLAGTGTAVTADHSKRLAACSGIPMPE